MGILVAVPFGIMADSKGRRLVIAICAIGFTLSDAWVIFVCEYLTLRHRLSLLTVHLCRLFFGISSSVSGARLISFHAVGRWDYCC